MKIRERLIEIKKNFFQYVPFVVVGLFTLGSMILVWLKPDIINENGKYVHYIVSDSVKFFGYGLLVNVALIAFHKEIWKYTFLLQLLLAVWGVISITSSTIKIGIGAIELELLSLLFLIVHSALNKEIVTTLMGRVVLDEEKAKQAEKESMEANIAFFINKFSTKSQFELQNISGDEGFTKAAQEAANRLLTEKYGN